MTTTVTDRWTRPTPEELQGLPTLAVHTPDQASEAERILARRLNVDFRLELKLESTEERYWLCTRGAPEPRYHMPESWIVGNVTLVYLRGDDRGVASVYGPDDVVEWQKWDYMNLIKLSIIRLWESYEKEPDPETWKEIEAAEAELHALGEIPEWGRPTDPAPRPPIGR